MAEIRQDVTISRRSHCRCYGKPAFRVERTRGGSRALIIFQQSPSGEMFALPD